jgi:hypothetical protein
MPKAAVTIRLPPHYQLYLDQVYLAAWRLSKSLRIHAKIVRMSSVADVPAADNSSSPTSGEVAKMLRQTAHTGPRELAAMVTAVNAETVGYWRKRFSQEWIRGYDGLDALRDLPRRGRPRHSEKVKSRVYNALLDKLTAADVARRFHMTVDSVNHIKAEIRFRQQDEWRRHWLEKAIKESAFDAIRIIDGQPDATPALRPLGIQPSG